MDKEPKIIAGETAKFLRQWSADKVAVGPVKLGQ